MTLTKNNAKRLLGKIAHYMFTGGDVDVYYYFPLHQEIIFSDDDADFDTLKIEKIPTYRFVGKTHDIARTDLNINFDEQILIVKSVPQDIERRAIKGIFGIDWSEE